MDYYDVRKPIEIRPISIYLGPEGYLKEFCCKNLSKVLGLKISNLDAEHTSGSQVVEMLNTRDLFNLNQILVVTNGTKWLKGDLIHLERYIQQINKQERGSFLVVLADKLDTKRWKGITDKIRPLYFYPMFPDKLEWWISDMLGTAGNTISKRMLNVLVTGNYRMYQLADILNQLIIYHGMPGMIPDEAVELSLNQANSVEKFKLLDCVISQNISNVYKCRSSVMNYVSLLSVFFWWFSKLLYASTLRDRGENFNSIVISLGNVKKQQNFERVLLKYPTDAFVFCIKELRVFECRVKSGSLNLGYYFDQLMLKLCLMRDLKI